ncbi:MAG: hypothetical protein LBF24_04045 [Puniceicoccales bacterium]|jgi:hypothetical protein|nr:hypothetical protein [Puniceicoccales bacterium]
MSTLSALIQTFSCWQETLEAEMARLKSMAERPSGTVGCFLKRYELEVKCSTGLSHILGVLTAEPFMPKYARCEIRALEPLQRTYLKVFGMIFHRQPSDESESTWLEVLAILEDAKTEVSDPNFTPVECPDPPSAEKIREANASFAEIHAENEAYECRRAEERKKKDAELWTQSKDSAADGTGIGVEASLGKIGAMEERTDRLRKETMEAMTPYVVRFFRAIRDGFVAIGVAIRSFFQWLGWNLGLCAREEQKKEEQSKQVKGSSAK